MSKLFAKVISIKSSADFFKNQLLGKILSGIQFGLRVGHFVGPDLGPKCLQGLSVIDISSSFIFDILIALHIGFYSSAACQLLKTFTNSLYPDQAQQNCLL